MAGTGIFTYCITIKKIYNMENFTYKELVDISESFFKLLCLDLKQNDMFSGIWKSNDLKKYNLLIPIGLTFDEIKYKYELAVGILSNLDVESISLRLIKGDGVHYIAVKTWVEDFDNCFCVCGKN